MRDISLPYHFFLALGFGVLIFTAYEEQSAIFLVKQIATFIPVLIIIFQIFQHSKDHWHDDDDPACKECNSELEPNWVYCPYCNKKN